MRCSHCSSLVFEVETLVDGHIEQSHFECSFCGMSQLVTRRLVSTNHIRASVADGQNQRNENRLGKYSL